jgi:hypothetical protein
MIKNMAFLNPGAGASFWYLGGSRRSSDRRAVPLLECRFDNRLLHRASCVVDCHQTVVTG